MIINLFWTIFFLTWWVGIVVAIHPIYHALMRSKVKNLMGRGDRDYRSPREIDRDEVVGLAFAACGLAIGWPLVLPFYLSFALHRWGKRPRLDEEIERYTAEEKHERQAKAQLKAAAKDVEAVEVRFPTPPRSEWP